MGAEALQESIIEQAEDEGWVKLEWYVLFKELECKIHGLGQVETPSPR